VAPAITIYLKKVKLELALFKFGEAKLK